MANYVLWPAAHFINFKFVPTQHRILYNNVVSVSLAPYILLFASLDTLTNVGRKTLVYSFVTFNLSV